MWLEHLYHCSHVVRNDISGTKIVFNFCQVQELVINFLIELVFD